MNAKIKLLIGGVLFVVLLAGAVFLYNLLSREYDPPKSPPDEEETEETTQTGDFADFTVTDENGQHVKLSQMAGKPIVINFWATWCGPCQSELPAFEEQYQAYGDEVRFMMVNLTDGYRETVDSVKAFCEEKGYTFPVYYDTENLQAATTYEAYSIPLTVFVDANGNVTDRHMGRMSSATLKEYIEACKNASS